MVRLSYVVLIIAIIAMNALVCVVAEEEMYSDRYDDLDIEEFLKTKALRDIYFTCYMEIVPCETPQQTYLTGIFSEAYQTNCKKCTEKQKKMFKRLEEWYLENLPERWEKIVAKSAEIVNRKTEAHQ